MSPDARTIVPGSWVVPAEVTLDESADLLCWSSLGESPRVQPRKGLLREFLTIRAADNAAILGFAKQWGPLWLCETHHRPIMHRRVDFADLAEAVARKERPSICQVKKLDDGRYAESLHAWRRLSDYAFLILKAGSIGRRGKLQFATYEHLLADILADPKDTLPGVIRVEYQRRLLRSELGGHPRPVRTGCGRHGHLDPSTTFPTTFASRTLRPGTLTLSPWLARSETPSAPSEPLCQDIAAARRAGSAINQWIEEGGGYPKKAARQDAPGSPSQEEVRSLYSAIAVGLWNVIGDLTTKRKCEYCGQTFVPARSNQKYCKDCGKPVRDRLSKQSISSQN